MVAQTLLLTASLLLSLAASTRGPGASDETQLSLLVVASHLHRLEPTTSPSEAGDYLKDEFAFDSDNPLEELSYQQPDTKGKPAPPAAGNETAPAPAPAASNASMISRSAGRVRNATANATEGNGTAPAAGPGGNGTTPASANATTPTNSTNATAVPLGAVCVTRSDPRVSAWFAETAAVGSPCVFGCDDRDEGSHCIFDGGNFGSNGWCYTHADLSSWGSCATNCPLYGPVANLGKLIDGVGATVDKIAQKLDAQSGKPQAAANATGQNMSALQYAEAMVASGTGPIAWLKRWMAGKGDKAAANASAISVNAAGTKKQVVAVPLQSQLLQSSSTRIAARTRGGAP